jgi:murein DD-endopeptidase MepM/ murein hydrolase activator NlpD
LAEPQRSRGGCLVPIVVGIFGLALIAVLGGMYLYRGIAVTGPRNARLLTYLREPASHPEWRILAGTRCGGAPFMFPTRGYVGYLWDDQFQLGHPHQGIDIFGGGGVGETDVIAAVSGYLTRQPDWKSTIIIRVPDDPLHPGRQIWTYYTHLAGPDGTSTIADAFPPDTREKYVEAGTILGRQGNFSGTPDSPVGVHLHFSIVLDNGQGGYLNELDIRNTLDPSPYLGLKLNANANRDEIPLCQ